MRIPLAATLVLVACGGGGTPATDGAADFDAAPTFGARMPKVIAPQPTDILANPKGMAITWDNDPNRASAEKFFTEYNAAAWATQTAEYGIGPLTAATPGHIAGNAPATVTEANLLAMLQANTTGAQPLWGAPDASTIYMFFIPAGISFDDGTGDLACGGSAVGSAACEAEENATGGGYDGYHFDTVINGVRIAYSIVGTCDCEALGLGISDLDDEMITAGHETLEAATDPFTAQGTELGWGEVDDAHSAWEFVTEGEVADMCEYAATQDWVSPPSMDFSIQRTWSNAAAAAGHDPCIGDAMTTYYQAIPADPDLGTVNFEGVDQHTAGMKIAVGSDGTLDLQLYSDDMTSGPYKISLLDYDGDYYGDDPADAILTFTQPTGTFMPGDTVKIPVHVKQTDGSVDGGEVYEIDVTPVGDSTKYTSWYAWVLQ